MSAPDPYGAPSRLLRPIRPPSRAAALLAGADPSSVAARRLGAMVEASGVVTLLCRSAGDAVQVLDESGSAHPAVVAPTLWAWIHPDDRAAARAEWAVGVASGGAFAMEWRTTGPNDPPRSAKFRAAPVQGSDEWIVALADVTDVRQAHAALHRERELSRSVIAASRDGILAFAPDHRPLAWNASFERLSHTPHALVASEPWIHRFPFAAPALLLDRVTAMLEDGQPFVHQEVFGDPAHGMERVLEFDFSPVHDADAQVTGGLCQVRDVTERLLLDGRRMQNAKMDAMGLLAAGIAHDFNNSLAAMMGLAELIEFDVPEGSPAADTARELVQSAQNARELVRQILSFARHEPVHLELLDARQVVSESLKLMRKLIPASIEVQLDLPTVPIAVHADAAQLQQVLVNLCTNAEHAMRECRGGTLQVALSDVTLDAEAAHRLPGLHPGRHAVLTIRDTGVGMTPDVLARICEPFYTTKAVGEGTGMGMAMVGQIVATHRGSFTIDSAPGVGTTVQIHLPLAAAAGLVPVRVMPEEPVGRGTVLVLDDEPVLAQLLADALMHFGFRTRAFLQPEDALAAFEANPHAFDAVVTDQGMPRLPGDLVAQRMLALRPDLPVILLTGYAPQISPERAAQLGIADVVTKPVSFRALAQTLVTQMASRRPQTTTAVRRQSA